MVILVKDKNQETDSKVNERELDERNEKEEGAA